MDIRQLIENVSVSFGPISLSTDLGRRKSEVLQRLKILEGDLSQITRDLHRINVEYQRYLSISRSQQLTAQERQRWDTLERESSLLTKRGDRIYDQIDDLNVEVRMLGGNPGHWSR